MKPSDENYTKTHFMRHMIMVKLLTRMQHVGHFIPSVFFRPYPWTEDTYPAAVNDSNVSSHFDSIAWWLARYEDRGATYWAGFEGARAVTIAPRVGMGATYHCGSDRYPYTVVEVMSEKRIKLRADRAIYEDGKLLGFEENPNGATIEVSLRSNGRWYHVGSPARPFRYTLGERHHELDPHF